MQTREETVGRHDQAPVGQDRLDDQARDGTARQMRLGEVETGRDVGLDIVADRPKRIGVGQEYRIGVRRHAGVDVYPRDAHRDTQTAVVTVLERQDGLGA